MRSGEEMSRHVVDNSALDADLRLGQVTCHAGHRAMTSVFPVIAATGDNLIGDAYPSGVITPMSFRDIVLFTLWLTVVVAGDLHFGGMIAFLIGW